jgi:hypothetical protein
MCDYSLMGMPNRLAVEGEVLVTHRFCTGSMGLASREDLKNSATPPAAQRRGFWTALKSYYCSPPSMELVPAVCIPPGARLTVEGIPVGLQRYLGLGVGSSEEVTFTQITARANAYRDAIRFENSREIRLQELPEGLTVTVLDLSLREIFESWGKSRSDSKASF